jgi:hypothetical protein
MPTAAQIEAATLAMMRYGNYPNTPEASARMGALARVALEAAEALDFKMIMAHRTAGRRIENAKRAFQDRYGRSRMLETTRFREADGRECVRVTDLATGTWAEYAICNKRVARLREHKPIGASPCVSPSSTSTPKPSK